ncbi:NAD(P)-binding protein [Microthyrium microscopicum]|uniref:NAD(P)-binding protein n=1 Tax=Microthyrium microscopicum TaxID=703497 RepID=A0A6A6UC80_9PEZI|nr:NAD(P)-binding protein [Microthyrium microscopicum]
MTDNKTLVFITGGNSGIGLETARQVLADASTHVLLGSRSLEKGQQAVEQLQSQQISGTVEVVQVDVSDEASVSAAAKTVESKYGRLDALVNNAGIAGGDGTTATQMTACLQTNAVGAYLMGEYFVPILKKSIGTPRIINVTSGAGSIGNRLDRSQATNAIKAIPYRVSKAAMNMVAACQWFELATEGFKVFIYGPGFTESNLSAMNKTANGAKPTSEGVAPIIAMLKGERDSDDGKFIEYGVESFPW